MATHQRPLVWAIASVAALALAATALGNADGPSGTRADPYRLGAVAHLGGFSVTVRSINRHAWPALEAVSHSNRPPLAGATYVLVAIRALNRGRAAAIPFVDGELVGVARSGRRYDPFSDGCGTIPTDVSSVSPISPDAAVVVHVCWEVASSDASSLLLDYEPYGDAPPTYFALYSRG